MFTAKNNVRLFFIISYVAAIFFIMPIYVLSEDLKGSVFRLAVMMSIVAISLLIYNKKMDVNAVVMTLIVLVILLCISIKNSGLVYIDLTLFLFLMLLYIDDQLIIDVSVGFVNIYVFVLSLSLIMYFFVHAFSIENTEIVYHSNPLKKEFGVYYKSFYKLLLVEANENRTEISYRFQSIFDEPGVVGTISGILLIGLVKVKMNVQKAVLIVSGFCSMSLAFFLFFIIYIVISIGIKRSIYLLTILPGLVVFLWLNPVRQIDGPIVEIVQQKIQRGNNRVDECFSVNFDRDFLNNAFFGKGFGATDSLGCDVSSSMAQIYDYGLIGLFSIFLSVSLVYYKVIFRRCNGCLFLFWLALMFINFYQRPHYFMPVFAIIGFCFVNYSVINKRRILGKNINNNPS